MPTYHVSKAKAPAPMTTEFRRTPKRRTIVLETLALLATPVFLAANAALSMYSWWGEPERLGMGDGVQEAIMASPYRTPFAPVTWTYAAWLAVFAVQGLWLVYAWSYACRQKRERTIFPGVYPAFWLACGLNIGYVYSVGHGMLELSLALVAAETLVMYVCVGFVARYLRAATTGLKDITRSDKWATHFLTLNGLAFYAAWLTIFTLLQLGAVLENNADVHPNTVGTILLSLLGALIVCYFLLEVTILDRFLRFVVLVYPAVVWWLVGTLIEHWNREFEDMSRNSLFVFVLMCVGSVLLVLHLVLILVFGCVRPMDGEGGEGEEDDMAQIIPS